MSKIDKFLKAHPTITHNADLQEICAPLKDIDLVYFSHANLDEKNRLSVLALNADFFQLYFNKGYHQFDLHLGSLPEGEHLILWDAIIRKKESKALHEDFMSFNQGHTFSIIYNHGDTKDCYHFATKLGNVGMNEEYIQKVAELKKFICYFKEMVARDNTLKSAYDRKIEIVPEKGGYLTETILTSQQWQKFRDDIPITRLYLDGTEKYLTLREIQCLEAMALGKTAEELAELLQISSRTVNAHVTNMKEKLGCDTQFQLGMWFEKLKKTL